MVAALALATLLARQPTGDVVVRERRGADIDDVRVDDPESADALLDVPGVSLVRSGGPLAPVRPVVRGLSGPRLSVSVLGVPFTDPAAGDIDAGLLPWSLGSVDVDVGAGDALGGAVKLKLGSAGGLYARVEAGSQNTLTGSARVIDIDGGDVRGFAVSAGTSSGDFAFVDENGTPAVRTNNDQHRAGAVAFADVGVSDDVRVRGAAAASLYEGGIPGFATAPLSLRGRRGLAGAGIGVSTRGVIGFDIDAFAHASERATGPAGVGNSSFRTQIDDDGVSRLVGTRIGGLVRAKGEVNDDIDINVTFDGATSALPDLRDPDRPTQTVQRMEFGTRINARARGDAGVLFGKPLALVVDADLAARVVDDISAFLPTGRLRVAVRRGGALVFVQGARSARAPTLDERFAPEGFVEGNPTLTAESALEGEAGAVVDVGRARARAVFFASSLDETIVLVARSAFGLVPINAGPARRLGADAGVTLTLHPLLKLDVAASTLASTLLVTHAPLPNAPQWLGRAQGRFGDDDAHLAVIVSGRSASSANQFGTQLADPALLVDLVGRLPIARTDHAGALFLTARVDNAFDVQTAEDSLLLPLPGRLVFVGLEVRG